MDLQPPASPCCLVRKYAVERPRALAAASRAFRAGWQLLRQVSGDDAYERYVAHMSSEHPGQPLMERSAYYRLRLQQKWNRITRCC